MRYRNLSCNFIVYLNEFFYHYKVPSFSKLFKNLNDIERIEIKKVLNKLNNSLKLKFRDMARISKFLIFKIFLHRINILSVQILSESNYKIDCSQLIILRRFHTFLSGLCELAESKYFNLLTDSIVYKRLKNNNFGKTLNFIFGWIK